MKVSYSSVSLFLLNLIRPSHAFKATLSNSFLSPSKANLANKNNNRSLTDIIFLKSISNNDNVEDIDESHKPNNDRRNFLLKNIALVGASTISIPSLPAFAGIDPSALSGYSVEGDISGVSTRLRQIEMDKNRPSDTIDQPFVEIGDGISYREYREGKGEVELQNGSKIGTEMSIRCKSFATNNEPGGVKYFSTKDDTEFNELAWTVGSGEFSPALEKGMMGMKKGSVRRIELPSTLVFAARNNNQLPLPSEKNKDGNRRFKQLFKTDATLLFEVKVTRIK